MVTPAIQLFPDDPRVGLVGVRFPVELRAEGIDPIVPSTWPAIDGRLEYFEGRLLYMPPCADFQQDVATDVAFLLRSWSEHHRDFVVGSNEAGMRLGGSIRAADVAVWRAADAGARVGRIRTVPPVLAVEIAGEDEEERVLRDKARWYLDNGVAVVWLVLPEARQAVVITGTSDGRFRTGERIPANDALPGLALEVAGLFAQIDR